MPRLSVIIPHRHDAQRLEETLLSVLENRPRDCEIIVVHDGSYHDPYQLSDEIVYVQEEPNSSVTELLNAGLMAACAPVVCTLLDGAQVAANWCEAALKRFSKTEVVAVAPRVCIGNKLVTGIVAQAGQNVAQLRARVDAQDSDTVVAPVLVAGFYRRRALLALGGWQNSLSANTADIELGLLMQHLELVCECEPNSEFKANSQAVPSRKSKQANYELAGIASAYGLVSAKLASALAAMATGCLTGNFATARSWAAGLLNSTLSEQTLHRLEQAKQHFATVQDSVTIKLYAEATADSPAVSSQRRKAA